MGKSILVFFCIFVVLFCQPRCLPPLSLWWTFSLRTLDTWYLPFLPTAFKISWVSNKRCQTLICHISVSYWWLLIWKLKLLNSREFQTSELELGILTPNFLHKCPIKTFYLNCLIFLFKNFQGRPVSNRESGEQWSWWASHLYLHIAKSLSSLK